VNGAKMPQRTNEFQKLVYLVRRLLSEESIVHESKMLKDMQTQQDREVDVCIAGKLDGQDILVSIECSSLSRANDIRWVEQMISKHQRLPTNKLILASQNGFTKSALKLACQNNVECISLLEIESENFLPDFKLNKSLYFRLSDLSIENIYCHVTLGDSEEVARRRIDADCCIYSDKYKPIGTVGQMAYLLLCEEKIRELVLKSIDEIHRFFRAGIEFSESDKFYLHYINLGRYDHIRCLEVIGKVSFESAPVSMNYSKMGEVKIAWQRMQLTNRDLLFAMIKNEDGSGKALLEDISGVSS
jgi:hypothetical protein